MWGPHHYNSRVQPGIGVSRHAGARKWPSRSSTWLVTEIGFHDQLTHKFVTITHFMVYLDGWVQEGRNSSALAMELRLSCTKPWILFLLAEVWLTVLPSTLTGRYEWVSESPISITDFIILINRYQIKLLILIVLWNLWLYHECVMMTHTW